MLNSTPTISRRCKQGSELAVSGQCRKQRDGSVVELNCVSKGKSQVNFILRQFSPRIEKNFGDQTASFLSAGNDWQYLTSLV